MNVRIEQIKWLTLFRVILISVLLVATVVFQLNDESEGSGRVYNYLYYLCTAFYVLSFIYTLFVRMLPSEKGLLFLTYVQLTGDVFMASAIVLVTGGTSSAFTFFFSLVIIAGATILFRKGAFFIATVSTVLMVTMALVETNVIPYLEVLKHYQVAGFVDHIDPALHGIEAAFPTIYTVSINVVAFYGVAFLASALSDQVRRSSARALEQAERFEELQAMHFHVVNSLETGLITFDLSRRVTFCNRSAAQITGFDPDELLGTVLTQHFRDLSFVLANPYKMESVTHEESIVALKRRKLYLAWSLSPLRDASDKVIGHTFLFQDITRTKELERTMKRQENMVALGEMASAVAHEIRNPLAAISGSIQMLRTSAPLDPDDQRLLNIVLRETDQLNGWINDFLAYSRLVPKQPEPVDLTAIWQGQIESFKQGESVTEVNIDLKSPQPVSVMGDLGGLRQIAWNLLNNAAEAMEHRGQIDVHITRGEESDVGHAVLTVSDEGCGIPLEEHDNIFRPFFTTKARGTGLGLAIVHRIVENHEGRITLDSEENKGTTFRILLPLTAVGESNA